MPATTTSTKTKNVKRFVTIPRKEYEELIALKKNIPILTRQTMLEKHILRLSQEAKRLKKVGKLPLLRSLRTLR